MLAQGFVPKEVIKIIEENTESFREYFGADFDSTPMNPLVKINEVFARAMERIWVELENYFDANQIWFATGRYLDDLAVMYGKERKPAQKASVTLTFIKSTARAVTIPDGTIIDDDGESFQKEFVVDADQTLSDIIIIQRGTGVGGADAINGYNGFTNIFDVQGVEWVSDNFDGSLPYVSGTDYTAYTPNDDEIDWAPGGSEPTGGAVYYVKVTGYSAYIDVEAAEVGSAYNADANEIFHLQTTVTGIASVTNIEDAEGGREVESDLELKARCVEAGYLLNNDPQMQEFIRQLFRVRSAKVSTLANDPHFRTLISIYDQQSIVPIYNEAVDETERRKGAGTHSVAILRLIKNATAENAFPSPYNQQESERGVWQIQWVAAERDGSSPYTPVVEYDTYLDYDNHITWTGAGSPPSTNEQFFVKLVRAVEIAETLPIEVFADVILKEGYDLTSVQAELRTQIESFVTSIGVGDTLYFADIARVIGANDGVTYVTNLRIRTKLKIWKGTVGGKDQLPIRGKGYADDGSDILLVSDEKDGSGTVYVVTTDWLWEQTTANVRKINWSPAGTDPTPNYPYWVYMLVSGDMLTINEIVDFEGVEISLLTS